MAGRNGAAASADSRQASTRSPRTRAEPRGRRRVAGLRGLREDPRLLGVDERFAGADELPERAERLVEQAAVDARPEPRERGSPGGRRAATRSGAGAGRSPPR